MRKSHLLIPIIKAKNTIVDIIRMARERDTTVESDYSMVIITMERVSLNQALTRIMEGKAMEIKKQMIANKQSYD
jgi:hypothetical protein